MREGNEVSLRTQVDCKAWKIKHPCLIQKVDLLGKEWPVWICSNTGVEYGAPECANVVIFGKCEPREDLIIGSKRRPRPRHRKAPREQKTLDGRTLWKARWGLKEDE